MIVPVVTAFKLQISDQWTKAKTYRTGSGVVWFLDLKAITYKALTHKPSTAKLKTIHTWILKITQYTNNNDVSLIIPTRV